VHYSHPSGAVRKECPSPVLLWLGQTRQRLALRRRIIARHRERMIRSDITILRFVLFRFIFVALESMSVGGPAGKSLRLSFAAWSAGSVGLLVTEVCPQWLRVFRSPATQVSWPPPGGATRAMPIPPESRASSVSPRRVPIPRETRPIPVNGAPTPPPAPSTSKNRRYLAVIAAA